MISIICNYDTRPGCDQKTSSFTGHNNGVRALDLLTHGLLNRIKFFSGFEIEVVAFIDEHLAVPDDVLREVRALANCVVIRKHSDDYRGVKSVSFRNDLNYLHAIAQARGEIICHVDQDTAMFAKDKESVDELLALTNYWRFVSYPSRWSPRAVDDPSFGKHTWASTRWFLCRREWFKFDALELALREPESAYREYGDPPRRCPWLEHFLALLNGESVIYPPRKDDRYLIFCWNHYIAGVMEKLNLRTYDEVLAYVNLCQGIHYPCDVTALNL